MVLITGANKCRWVASTLLLRITGVVLAVDSYQTRLTVFWPDTGLVVMYAPSRWMVAIASLATSATVPPAAVVAAAMVVSGNESVTLPDAPALRESVTPSMRIPVPIFGLSISR